MNDPHMHERGMLERIDHPELGEIVVPTTPLRLHGTDKVEASPSPTIGQHNAEIYGGWLGLGAGRNRGAEGDRRHLVRYPVLKKHRLAIDRTTGRPSISGKRSKPPSWAGTREPEPPTTAGPPIAA